MRSAARPHRQRVERRWPLHACRSSGVYNSTKYAVESLSEALRYELRPFASTSSSSNRRHPHELRSDRGLDLGPFRVDPYAVAVEKYEQMSKFADKFASNPIVIAKAISRAVRARRPSARYVAPWKHELHPLHGTRCPDARWDWAMRKVGFLNAKSLGLATKSPRPLRGHPADSADVYQGGRKPVR